MDIYNTATLSDNFDIAFTENGFVSISEKSSAVADRLKVELSSNSNWSLDDTLGMNWVDKYSTGLLQVKDPEPIIVMALERKINSISGVKEIVSISLSPVKDRSILVDIVVKTTENEEIRIQSEVG